MGSRGWTPSTFVGCCIWILHGLRAAAAIPVTTEGPFAVDTASPVTAESEGSRSLVMVTVEKSAVATDENILAGSPSSPSFLPRDELDALVTAASEYGSTVPTLSNVTKPFNTTQDMERSLMSPAVATTAAAISEQHVAVTPEAELDVARASSNDPLGTTALPADAKEDILTAVTREGSENLDSTSGDVVFITIPPSATTWQAQPTAGSPIAAGATTLSQGLATATGAGRGVEEGVALPVDTQTETSAISSNLNPGITPEAVGEMGPAAEERPSALVPGNAGDAVNGELSTVSSAHLPPESPTVSGTVGNAGETSLLPGQAVLSPGALLTPASDGDGDGQGAPGVSSEAPGSALSSAASEVPTTPKVTEDMATSLLAPGIPTDSQSDTNPSLPGTAPPMGDVQAVGPAKPSLQPAPWQTATGEQQLAAALPSSTDNPSASGAAYPPLGAAYPPLDAAYQPPGSGAGTLPAAVDGAEAPASLDIAAASGTPVSPSLGESEQWNVAAGAPQGADGSLTGLSSATEASNPASFVPGELARPAAGVQSQGAEGAGDTAQAGGPGDGSPYADIQSDTSPSAFSAQQDPTNTGELLAEDTGALENAELSPSSDFGAGEAPALGEVSLPAPAPPGNAGLEPTLSQPEGPGDPPGKSANAPGAAYPPPVAVAGPVSGAETPVSLDLGAAQGAPVSPSLGWSQPWGAAAGGAQGAGLPGANGPATGLTSAWDAPSSAAQGPAEPPSPALGDQLGTNLGLPATEAHGSGTREPVLGGSGSGTGFEPSLSSAAGSGTAAGVDQPSGADSLSSPSSPSDVVAASSASEGDGAAHNPATAPGPDSLGSPDREIGPDLSLVQGTESSGSAAQTGNPESERPFVETNPSAFSVQQDPTNTGELLAEDTGALENAELSPSSDFGAGEAPALGEVSLPAPAPPGNAGLEPTLSQPEGPGDPPGKSANAPGAAYPPLVAVAGPVSGAETPVSLDLGAAQGAPVSPSLGWSQPWGAAAGGAQGAGLPGANGPATGLTSAWDAPSSAAQGPAEPPSPALGDQLGTNLGLPATEAHGSGTRELVLGGSGSGTGFEPPLSSAAGSGTAAGVDQPSGADSLSSPSSPSDVVAASSVSDPARPSVLGGADSAPGALQPSLGAGPGVPPAAGEGAGEVTGDGGSLGQSQAPAGEGSSGSGASDGETGSVLQSVSSSPATEGSSSLGTAGEAANGANLPGAGGASSGLSTVSEAAGLEEPPVSTSSIQSGADLGLSDAKPSQTDAVELPGGASVNGGPSPGASLGQGSGTSTQITSGALAPSALTSPQEMQPPVPVAPESSGVSNDMASSPPASLPLPGHGLSSGLAPSGDLHPLPGMPSGLSGDAEGTQTWPLEDEVASGMPAPSGETYPGAPVSPNAAPALLSSPQRENAAEGASTSPGLSTPLSARESVAGSSAGGRGELGAAMLGGSALLLPPHQPGSPGAPSDDADSTEQVGAVLPGSMAGRGDMAQLLPSTTGARAGVESPTHSPLGGSSGLPGLPPTGIATGSSGSKILGPGPAGGSSPAALQPSLGNELTTSLANRAPATGGSRLPAAFPGQGGGQGILPLTTHPAVSCSPTTLSSALPAPLPGVREVLPRPEAATATSRASSPVSPALPGGPVAIPTSLSSPTVAAVPLYGYGARENDKEYVERRVNFNSPLFKPETGFPFGKTLRDSLYFTDNGQIIFPSSDNNVIAYPNPPPRGFNGHEEVPMIAVFWDNADFSRGVGTTFYQEFTTLNTAKPPFVRDVETKIRRYLRSSYSAAWTLKITWEKAPAYTAQTDTRRTITYQAILTTDGFRSYILMLYQDGGMQWDYNRLAATNVLIGYTSGDGFYRNDDLTQRPPAAKYRPDQFRGYNTDLRGLWIYKLESRVGFNYRLKCLAWIGRQQEPQTWSHGLPTCPCSLQQGQQDPRFKSSRGGWWAARVSMLHSASPNQHGAGVRCLYNSQSQLIEGRQERYWRSSRQASPYRDQELKLYDWCCNQAGSARLCNHYGEKRPKIGCDGYQSPSMAGSSEETESDSEEQRDGEDE